MVSPDRLSERQVQDYILYLRDELLIAKGTWAQILLCQYLGLRVAVVH